MRTLPMRQSMAERKTRRTAGRICPVCEKPSAPGCVSCNRRACVKELRAHRIRDRHWSGGQKYVDPELLRSEGPGICPHCRGAKWFTTYDGVAYEGCDAVGPACPWEAKIPLQRPHY